MSSEVKISSVTLHSVTPTCVAELLSLMQAYYAYDHLDFNHGRAAAAVAEFVENPSLGHAWFVEVSGQRAGYLLLTFGTCLEFHGRTAVVDEFFITESFRGQGLGPKVLRMVEEFCREAGMKAMRLEVEHENAKAQRVYERFGFKTHARHLMTKVL